ncbi:MAG: NADH-quinone oxidoreductase subunit H [Elusimicrobia bacterium]|nr:NADH-quinone oxidoreductase subunit H [Elusimicrobiota bacterium]
MTAAWPLLKVAAALGFGLNVAGLLAWAERKQSAVMQDRIGANRAAIFGFKLWGLIHMLADTIKLLTKEDFVPKGARKGLHGAAPVISLGFALLCLAALPFGGVVEVAGRSWSLQPVESPVGLLFVLAMLGLGVHGVMMAGYASGSNYGLLGALRGGAQMISYEVCLAASLAGLLFIYGTLDLQQAVLWQGRHAWGILVQPLGFLLFVTAGVAETKRAPFDLPEGESEIVGYFVEYSGMKMGMFMMTDFVESVVVAGLVTTLFLGGWTIPFYEPHGALGAVLMLASFTVKLFVTLFLLMQVRWTLPRFRFDQLLHLGWKNVLPLALANFIVTIWAVYLRSRL